MTCLVALATLCDLALPERNGERDEFIRLARCGHQRQQYTGAASTGHDEVDSRVTSTNDAAGDQVNGPQGSSPAMAPNVPAFHAPCARELDPVLGYSPILIAGGLRLASERAPPTI